MQDLENIVFKVKALQPVVKGISQRDGQAWQRRDVVLEAEENVVYPDALVATLHGSMIEKFTLQEGDSELKESLRRVNVATFFRRFFLT